MSTAAPQPRLSDEQLGEMLRLIDQADSVELKLTISDGKQRSALHALEIDPLEAQIRQVFFFETPDLALNRAGVVVRARRVQGRGDDSVVKLRPVEPHQLPEHVRSADEFGVEVDAMPGGFVCSGSMKHALPHALVRETVGGAKPVHKLFSKAQRAFYAEHAPEGLELDDLSVFGPVFVLKLRLMPAELKRRLVAELWLYPDNTHILELSLKCPPSDAFLVAAQTRAFLAARAVDTSGEQHTKTKQALEFFSRQA
jgi:hypothetical protein